MMDGDAEQRFREALALPTLAEQAIALRALVIARGTDVILDPRWSTWLTEHGGNLLDLI